MNTKHPHFISIINTSNSPKTAIIFGFTRYGWQPNFGSEFDVEIKMESGNIQYGQLLYESAIFPFEVTSMRIKSENITQLHTSMLLNNTSSNGEWFQRPIEISKHYNPENFTDTKYIDVVHPFRVDAKTYIEYIIQPKTQVDIRFFSPEEPRSLPKKTRVPTRTH